MGLFSASFRNAVQGKRSPPIFAVVDLDLPSGAGGKLRFSDGPVPAGAYAALQRIPGGGIGSVSTGVTTRPSDLGAQHLTVDVIDTDFFLQSKLVGRYDCRRSPVTLLWGHPEVAGADWFVLFKGILDDWSVRSALVTLNCTTDDRALQGFIPKRQILKGAFPGAPSTSLGLYAPAVLGIHDAQGLTGTGMIPTVPISIDAALGYRYMVSLGKMKVVPRVYKNGVLQTLTTHYTVNTGASAGGLVFTSIDMVSATTSSDTVTCDVEGLTDDGTTSGSVITDPVEQLKWLLENLVWGDWTGGAYLTGVAPTDPSAFAVTSAYAQTFGYEGARRLGGGTEQVRATDEISAWLKSWPMLRLRWSNDGKLGPKAIDHRFAPYAADLVVRGEAHDVGQSFRPKNSAAGLLSKVSMEYLYGAAAGKYWQRLEIQELDRWQSEKVPESFSFAWGAARFQ